MRKLVMNLQNYMFADAVEMILKDNGDFMVVSVEKPEDTVRQCKLVEPDVLFLEVTTYTPWKLEERMKIWDEVKAIVPECKIVLLTHENVERALSEKIKELKVEGIIDGFIYSSISATYLSALMETI